MLIFQSYKKTFGEKIFTHDFYSSQQNYLERIVHNKRQQLVRQQDITKGGIAQCNLCAISCKCQVKDLLWL